MSTKIPAPERTTPYVGRARLYPLFQQAGTRLILLIGAPGSGKTSLVREWSETLPEAEVAWVDLRSAAPHGQSSFWHAVLVGLTGPEGNSRRRVRPTTRALLESTIERIRAAGQRVVLVLDGYETVSDDTGPLLTWFLGHCPPLLTVVMTTRREPSLPLGRWRVRGELAEIRDPELRLNAAETMALLPGLDDGTAAALAARTDGWATGLQLAAAAAARAPNPLPILEWLDGTQEPIAEVLLRDGWREESAEMQRFLAATAALETFDASLCDAVLDQTNSAAFLADLEARHNFIVPLTGSGRWFRYHRLFADVLRRELRRFGRSPEQEIQRRAAQWHVRFGPPETAITYALAGGDLEVALEQLSAHHVTLAARGRWPLLLGALNGNLSDLIPRSPDRAVDYAWILACNGLVERAASVATRAVNGAGASPGPRAVTTAGVIEALADATWGDDETALSRAERFEARLTDDHPATAAWSGVKSWVLGLGGRYEDARSGFSRAERQGARPSPFCTAIRSGLRAEVLVRRGQLREAAVDVRCSLDTWPASSLHPGIGAALRAQAALHIESGSLDEAEVILGQALRIQDEAPFPMQGALTAFGLAELARARGRPDDAIDHLSRAAQTRYARPPGRLFHSYLAEARVRAELDRGALGQAAQSLLAVVVPGPAILLGARLALAAGDPSEALSLSEVRWPAIRSLVEANLIMARAFLPVDRGRAEAHVRAAVAFGVPEGFSRIFQAEIALAEFYPVASGSPRPDGRSELSARELEVLRLLGRDVASQEIASQLYLSINTVKAHTRTLYRKLGVHDRAEAVRRARALGLL